MKLHKRISISGKPRPLTADALSLSLLTPGRAVFTVISDVPLNGVVVFECGYQPENIKPWFIGFVEQSTTVDAKQQRIFCRELTAVLFKRLPISLRAVTIKQVLDKVSALSALNFMLPKSETTYTRSEAPAFFNIANGYYAMDSLASVFMIKKPLWQQQSDGSVFVGSWDDSPWATKKIDMPRTWESDVTSANGATVPALPALRPGAIYNGSVLTNVEFAGVKMKLTWSKDPWAER